MTGTKRLWERKALAAGILVLSLVVLGAGYRVLRNGAGRFFDDFFYPYLHLSKLGSSKLADMSLLAYSRRELAAKLEDLQRRNKTLALQAAAAGELLQENEELRKLIEFAPPGKRNYLAAEIILRDPLMWRERFTVDRGEADGVHKGAAVINVTGDGRMFLVGVIERVGRHTSTVTTLRSSALRISARLGSGGAVGFVNSGVGRGGDGTIPIGYLPAAGGCRPGEAVLTTGFESGIPPGVTIGVLAEVERRGSLFSDRPYLSGKVDLAADLDTLRFVVIATNVAPGGGRR